jgi:siroheme synthase
VLAVVSATTPRERRWQATIGNVASIALGTTPEEPVLFIIGRVAALDEAATSAIGTFNTLRGQHALSLA